MSVTREGDTFTMAPRRSTRVFYVGCGHMPPSKIEAYMKVFRESITQLDNVHYENIFIPTREESSRVEVFP